MCELHDHLLLVLSLPGDLHSDYSLIRLLGYNAMGESVPLSGGRESSPLSKPSYRIGILSFLLAI